MAEKGVFADEQHTTRNLFQLKINYGTRGLVFLWKDPPSSTPKAL